MTEKPVSIQVEIQQSIYLIRGTRVMLDSDLAALYEVPTKVLIQAVKRNIDRFPEDFMFQLAEEELSILRSQFVISSLNWGGRRYLPYVFTEQGIAMLSSVLKSTQAIQVNIEIMRTFVQLRKIMHSHKELKDRLVALENKCDKHFKVVFQAIHELMESDESTQKRKIGFHPWK